MSIIIKTTLSASGAYQSVIVIDENERGNSDTNYNVQGERANCSKKRRLTPTSTCAINIANAGSNEVG
jgi:hypothetical protein